MHRLHLGSQILSIILGRNESVCDYIWDPLSLQLTVFRQPILADEVQTFKALITVHKVLQEGHPIAVKEAQANTNWLESLTRGISGDGLRGTLDPPLIFGQKYI